MLFNEFEKLVNYAVGGSMVDAEVTDVVKQLKNEKTNIMRNIALLPAGEERRTSFKRLHDLMYQLYDAKIYIANDTYKKRDVIANMILCYDCK